MPCYHPIVGYASREVNPSGKRSIVFNHREGYYDQKVSVPCGQCVGCRLERSRQWAIRCVHEASLYEANAFITLTISDDCVLDGCPSTVSLDSSSFPKFMKRLRKLISPSKVRYFHCGEYGELMSRPHHHACLFGYDFPDKVLYSVREGVRLYRSATLEKLWPFGYCTVGDVTFESAAYVARYVMKKVTGKPAAAHYAGRLPEYVTMSRRPGVGHDWCVKYLGDCYPHDFTIIRGGIKCKPPKYYDSIFDLTDHRKYALLKGSRERAVRNDPEGRVDRLYVREKVKNAQVKFLKRGLE